MNVAIYDTNTGAIDRIVECFANNVATQCDEGESYKILSTEISDATHYIDVGVEWRPIKDRVAQEYAVEVSDFTVVITGLAPGTLVSIDAAEIVADDEPTELEFDVPGVHAVRISGLAAFVEEEIEVQIDG